MSQKWEIRSIDTPRADPQILSTAQVLEFLETGALTGDDLVRADESHPWLALENHPAFEETLQQIEESNRRPPEDETRLDMNPLIDVSLVLLIFFILTTSYAELRKEANPPPGKTEKKDGKAVMSEKQLKDFTITVEAKLDGEKVRYLIEKEVVEESDLENKFKYWLKKTGKASLSIEIEPQVPFKSLIAIQDAAAGAGIQEMIRVDRK